MNKTKTYLGDSVYADIDGDGFVLTTENGMGASNTIYMEAEVIDAFIKMAAKYFNFKIEEK